MPTPVPSMPWLAVREIFTLVSTVLSVVIPVYNKSPYLRECLDSVLAQTFTEIEVIAIDDRSTGAGTGTGPAGIRRAGRVSADRQLRPPS